MVQNVNPIDKPADRIGRYVYVAAAVNLFIALVPMIDGRARLFVYVWAGLTLLVAAMYWLLHTFSSTGMRSLENAGVGGHRDAIADAIFWRGLDERFYATVFFSFLVVLVTGFDRSSFLLVFSTFLLVRTHAFSMRHWSTRLNQQVREHKT